MAEQWPGSAGLAGVEEQPGAGERRSHPPVDGRGVTLRGRAIIYQALVFVMAEDDILLRSHDTGGFFLKPGGQEG